MTQAEIYIEELKTLVRNTDQESRERMDEIANWFKIHNTSENMKLYELYVKSAEKLGLSIGHSFVGGASDGNKIAQNGVCVLDGLGAIGKGIHAVNEQVNIEVYLERIALLVALLMNIQ